MRRATLLSLLLLCGLGLPTAASAGATELEGHDTAPALEEVEAREHFSDQPEARDHWQRRLNASIEFAAMASVLYRKDLALFNARDGAIPYYVLRYLDGGQPSPHVGLIALSPNTGSMDHAETSAYLRENGVSDETLASGRRLVLLDGSIGWGRTLGRIRREISPGRRHELLAHAMMGFGEDHGPLQRMSLLHLWDRPDAGARMPVMTDVDARWENGITFDVNPVQAYARGRDGRLVPQAQRASDAQRATGRQWKEHLRHLLDRPETRAFFESRRALWTEAVEQLGAGDSAALLHWLDRQFDRHPGPLGEAIVRDVTAIALKHHRARYTWDYLGGFSDVAETLAGRRGAESIREPLRRLGAHLAAGAGALPPPPDGSLLSNPHTGAVFIVDKGHKWWIPDPTTFTAMGLRDGDIRATEPDHLHKIPDTEHLDLKALGRVPRDGSLLRDPENGAVYLMTAGHKWHVPDPQTMRRMGLHRRPLHQVPRRFLSQIPTR